MSRLRSDHHDGGEEDGPGSCGRHAHEGRHTAVSIVSSNGVPLQEISDAVGHKSTPRDRDRLPARDRPSIRVGFPDPAPLRLEGHAKWQLERGGGFIGALCQFGRGYQVIQQLPGIGPVLAAVIIAEIGVVHRFRTAGQLCSWAGLTPRHRESDVKVTRGHVTKQGSPRLRRVVIEAVQRVPGGSAAGAVKDAIIARRGKEARNIAKVAAARRLLTLISYGMRDGQIRCLSSSSGQPPGIHPADPARE
jgi:Transposase IS116/IS110/IS902 family